MAFRTEKPAATTPQSLAPSAVGADDDCLVIGLINNMPDAALEATEAQFSKLLSAAAGNRSIRLRLSYLPEVRRSPEAQQYLRESYWPPQTLREVPLDALIVTGAEPLAPALAQEPYWASFIEMLDWAQVHTISSIWSCLAAHAAVQHLSGITRERLSQKCCGVYAHEVSAGHPLNEGLTAPLLTPQSRWNDLPVSKLRAAGYAVASQSAITGANVFTKQCASLLVFLQGHPEYESCTLLREYRRDVARFLSGQNTHYPVLPQGYFSESATVRLAEYQTQAIARRSSDWIAHFPFEAEARDLIHSWKLPSTILYANWLSYIERVRGNARKLARHRDDIITE
jgi:homoserine O-succinyltransferase/O-acetyltransferase